TLSSQQNSDSTHIKEEKSRKRKLKSVNTLLIITFFYVLCYLPHTVRMVFRTPSQFSSAATVFGLMTLVNSSFNSIIYIARTKNISTFYRRLFVKYIYRE
uniref:G-protein coupled receptors family 1 profile domain-containing protein n=1 Tax=Clytia hemisphaerica TaxID=252671 RepID=A0A7M5WR46_9CNID